MMLIGTLSWVQTDATPPSNKQQQGAGLNDYMKQYHEFLEKPRK